LVLVPLLAAILFGLFGFILPRSRWTDWREASLIAAGGAVALLIAWPSRQPLRDRIRDGLAAVLGLASVVTGMGASLLLAYGLGLNIVEYRGSRQSFMYQMFSPAFIEALLHLAAVAAVPGAIALLMARRRLREVGRISLAGMAARFSILGLGCSVLIAGTAAVAAVYRWVTWG
jgi:hypothetical protein